MGESAGATSHRPPGADAKAAAARLRAFDPIDYDWDWDDDVVVDLGVYARAVDLAGPCGCAGGWGHPPVTHRGGDGR